MDFVKILKDTVPEATQKAQQSILDAQRRLELLRVKNPEEADIFSQQLAGAISNRQDPREILASIGKSYGMSVGKPVSRTEQAPREDESAKAAMINAALAGFGARIQDASSRGIQVPEQVVSSIQSLINVGKTEEASKLQDQILGPVETPLQRDARIRETRGIEAAEKEQKQRDKKSIEEAQIVYSALKRDQKELEQLQKEDISDVVGFTEPPARFFRRVAAEGGAEWAKENELLRKKLINQTTGDIFEQARKIAPVTQTDLNWLRTVVVPAETDDSSIWSDFLSKKKQVVDEKIAQIESDPEIATKLEITGIGGKNTPTAEPKSASDRLRAKRQQNGN